MKAVKNQVFLCAAFTDLLRRRPDLRAHARLRLVGDGPLRADCAALLAAGGCAEAAEFAGDSATVADDLRDMDVFVLPSLAEGISNTILEAMASGTPVVASDIDAFSRVLEDGEAGYLFRNEDPADLAFVINQLLDDPARREKLSAAGRDRASEFDWQTVAARILDVYASVTVTGERVTEDLRGQVIGRLSRRSNDRDEADV